MLLFNEGWYNNKIAGLLGTMDNEPSTDLTRPDRVREEDVVSLSRSWEVSTSPNCKVVENLARAPVIDDQDLKTCGRFFGSSTSPLKSCYSTVDPDPYYKLCLESRNDGCQAAATYVEVCATRGIRVRLPAICVRCPVDHDFIAEGEVRRYIHI